MARWAVMFQKGYRVGARSLRIEYPEAGSYREAVKKAKAMFPEWKAKGYYLYRVVNEDEELGGSDAAALLVNERR